MAADFQPPTATALHRLVEVCERGLGVAARLWLQRPAQSDAIQRQRDAQELAAVGRAPLIQAENSLPSLVQRANRRVMYQEARRQMNLEDILDEARRCVGSLPQSSDRAVTDDWIDRFFAIAQDVSYPPMKKLWGRVLAGEVRRPGSFSMRCLEVVRSLTQLEADALGKIAPFVVNGEAVLQAPDLGGLLQMGEFHALMDAGVVSPNLLQWEVPAREARVQLADVLIQLKGGQSMAVDARRLTHVGRELVPLLGATANRAFIRWFLEQASAYEYRSTLHRMVSRDPVAWDPRPVTIRDL